MDKSKHRLATHRLAAWPSPDAARPALDGPVGIPPVPAHQHTAPPRNVRRPSPPPFAAPDPVDAPARAQRSTPPAAAVEGKFYRAAAPPCPAAQPRCTRATAARGRRPVRPVTKRRSDNAAATFGWCPGQDAWSARVDPSTCHAHPPASCGACLWQTARTAAGRWSNQSHCRHPAEPAA